MIKSSVLKNSVLFVISALLPLAAAKASAQAKDVIVEVPFAFQANHANLPAGHYRIMANGSFLTFSNADTGTWEAVLLSRPEAGYAVEDEAKLEFYVSGDRHVLTEVRFGATGSRSILLRQPKPEHTIASNSEPSRIVEISSR